MKKVKILSLFSGIGAYEEALKNIGIELELIGYSEINPYSAKAYSILHEVNENKNLGDIIKINEKELEDFDLMTYSFPCQDISALGKKDGLIKENGELTRSGLFFEAIRLAKYKKPKYMVAENVKNLLSKKMKNDFESMLRLLDEIGYNTYFSVINSKDQNLPHSRNRVYIVSIRKDVDTKQFVFPNKLELTKKASDYYETEEVGDEYYLNEHQINTYLNEFRIKKKYSSLNADVIICQTTKQGNLSNPQNFIKDEKGIRVMTPNELLRLQGFGWNYGDKLLANGLTKEKIGFMAGNSVPVPVLEAIFRNLFNMNT